MAIQRLTQDNADSLLRLTKDDLLIATETPRFDGKLLRIVRMRVARDGFAERSVHDIGFGPTSFWHYWNYLTCDRVKEIAAALEAAKLALVGKQTAQDPNGSYRVIQRWTGRRPARLRVQSDPSVAQDRVPAFDAAWSLIVSQFPELPESA